MDIVDATIRNMNAYGDIRRTTHARVDPKWLLHTNSFSLTRFSDAANNINKTFSWLNTSVCSPCAPLARPDNSIHSAGSLSTLGFEFPGRFDLSLLSKCLDRLLYNQGDSRTRAMQIFRIKGILRVTGDGFLYILQGVHELFEIIKSDVSDTNEGILNRIVVIGRHIDGNAFREKLTDCIR